MLAKLTSGVIQGVEGVAVIVEVDIAAAGLPSFTIVGLGDRSIEESRERVRSAIKNIGGDFPAKRITINLAPADLQKEGPLFDLPIAIGILLASGQVNNNDQDFFILGELSLDGQLRKSTGVLPLTMLAKRLGLTKMILPKDNAKEASLVAGIDIFGFENLTQIIKFLNKQIQVEAEKKAVFDLENDTSYEYDFSQIKGQEQAKRALEIAAGGAHNILLKGPPGAGKTLLARAFPSILPPLTLAEALEVTRIYSITNSLPDKAAIITTRPFRAPHHSASHIGLIGGGNNLRPGEVSMAHRGVLFLDEIPEFTRQTLEVLRQPLEDRKITISRASGVVSYPAQFILVASQNPCPCGYLGSLKKECVCNPGQIARYQKRISGPLLDRIDMHLDVPAVDVDKLTGEFISENSHSIRTRVKKARQIQLNRFAGTPTLTNAEMNNSQIKEFCVIAQEGMNLLKLAIAQMNLSARAYHRILKVSRTIADLADSNHISQDHVAEALLYRFRDEN